MNKTTCLISVIEPASEVVASQKPAIKNCARILVLFFVYLWDLLPAKSLSEYIRVICARKGGGRLYLTADNLLTPSHS